MPIRSRKRLEKLLFAATNDVAIDGIAHHLLFFYHSQQLLFSHSKNYFSTTLTPTEKPRYRYCRVFLDSIHSKTIDIIRKIIFFFLEFCMEYYWCYLDAVFTIL